MRPLTAGVLALALLTAWALPGWAQHDMVAVKRFTDPAAALPMPGEWSRQPLKREPRGVDLSVVIAQQTFQALLPFIHGFAAQQRLKIAVREGTCGVASGELAARVIDVGGFCCPPDEIDRLPGLTFHTLGITGLALFVHPDNPIESVSLAEARRIFGGEALRWNELSDPAAAAMASPIRVVTRLHCKARPGHWRLLLDDEDAFSRDSQDVSAISDIVRQVALHRNAIGYETVWHAQRYRNTHPVKMLRVNGFDPSDEEALLDLRYPLYQVIALTTWDGVAANPLADMLVAHLMAQEGAMTDARLVPARRLRDAGWRFRGAEVVGEPDGAAGGDR